MELERIERALRDGPPDEPDYEPGAFRHAGRPLLSLAVTAVVVGITLVAGIVVGTGLSILRQDVGSPPEPRVLVAADLRGIWRADPLEFDAWTQALLTRGFTQADIDAFLEHDPFEDQVQYQLRFVDERFIVQAAYDEQPVQTLGGGTFALDEHGLVDLVEVVDGVEAGCEFTVAAVIDVSQLLMDVLQFRSCNTEERMANTLFFDVATYDRAED